MCENEGLQGEWDILLEYKVRIKKRSGISSIFEYSKEILEVLEAEFCKGPKTMLFLNNCFEEGWSTKIIEFCFN